jgi:hypothetical protein
MPKGKRAAIPPLPLRPLPEPCIPREDKGLPLPGFPSQNPCSSQDKLYFYQDAAPGRAFSLRAQNRYVGFKLHSAGAGSSNHSFKRTRPPRKSVAKE